MSDSGRETPQNVIGRLSLYRRLLSEHWPARAQHIYSHQLAHLACVSPAQVRRDLMSISFTGSPSRGYSVEELIKALGKHLDDTHGQKVALIGVGSLGHALMTYLHGRRANLAIAAAFDSDPQKINRDVLGCRCHPIDELETVIARQGITAAVLTVPASEAQRITDRLVRAGVKGILNYAPVRLRVPDDVFLEDLDMTMALERVAYFARQRSSKSEAP